MENSFKTVENSSKSSGSSKSWERKQKVDDYKIGEVVKAVEVVKAGSGRRKWVISKKWK